MTADHDLPADLRDAVASLAACTNVCHLVSLADLDDVLPARLLSRTEADGLLAALADAGLHIVEPDAAEQLARQP